MDDTANPVTFRIAYCRRQWAKARTALEMEAWRAAQVNRLPQFSYHGA